MTYAIRSKQARCAALGFYPGPIDGVDGKRTQAAYAAAVASQNAKGLPFQHPSGLTRIHIHWTGGHHVPNATDKKPYHILILGDGTVLRVADPWLHRSHTLNANSGAASVSMCCMANAVERPFQWGSAPMAAKQLQAAAGAVASLCIAYDIPVSVYSTPMHSEIQPVLGIKQRNKWDCNIIPGMTAPGDPITVGNKIRSMISTVMKNT